ncbi:MAG: UDP-N-acetylmuramoyl-tripeptide--D-alanyl-D-alanine ligase [Chlamydiales bacterium]|nr:UDP-N-acetylmuramoyl-tripeptide--D-alanyl-D-alanine ligase [Chlamydiales bacterium]
MSIDSRLVKPGSTFYAIKGNQVDGHNFLEKAAKNGATEAVVQNCYRGPSYGMKIFHVPDVLEEMRTRARLFLERYPKRIVAISGSVGKTTTKLFAAQLLEKHFFVWASPKSYNSQLTVPLSILMCPKEAEILILEMGMSEPGQIKKLLEIAPPEIALLTQVSIQHADGFKDGYEGILREKLSLFSHPKTRLCLHPRSVPGFGKIFEIEPHFDLQGPILHNFCAAKAIAEAFGVTEFPRKLKLPSMRLEEVKKGQLLFINDAYNANADSMIAALKILATKSGRKVAILSEMNALGTLARQEHEKVAREAIKCVDLLLCLGKHCERMQKLFEEAGKEAFYFSSKEALRQKARMILKPGDTILLKGARAYAMEEILDDY